MPLGTLRRLLRSILTVGGCLSIVVAEFLLLSYVYHRPEPVRTQARTEATLAGALMNAPTASARVAAETASSVTTLQSQGVSAAELAPLRSASVTLSAQPTNAAALARVKSADIALGQRLGARESRIDNEADLTYVILLALASVGWFGWFRRVIRRQRELQRQMTEQSASAEAEAKLAALVRNASDVITVMDVDATMSYVSPAATAVLGAAPEDLLASKFTDLLHPEDIDHFIHVLTSTKPGGEQQLNVRIRRSGRDQIYAEGEIRNLVEDPHVRGLIVTVRDVTERHLLEEQLTHQALHDSLTGLANRRLFADRLGHALTRRGDRMEPQMVLFIDLDDFKTVNDSLGHGTGDAVLGEIGSRIGHLLRAGDTVARVGGDEFAVLLEGASLEEAQDAADRLLEEIARPIALPSVTVQINASIGVAQAVPGETTAEEALRNADLAMYWAKDNGKGTRAIYESRLHTEALERLQLRADLQHALRSDELVLHFQPEINLATGAITGVEALIRWQHPTRGLLAPVHFIPMAEETGLITSIDRWVIRTACKTAAELQDDPRGLTVAVNVSAAGIDHPELVPTVAESLRENNLAPNRLVLEITESAILRDLAAIAPRLAELRAMGVRIAIDDFGTGYSSLSYLSQLDVDILKIDKSFVDRVTLDHQDAAVTEGIISIGQSLALETIAEGVEDHGQADWLRSAGCAIGQGFVWSKPVDGGMLRKVLIEGLPVATMPRTSMIVAFER